MFSRIGNQYLHICSDWNAVTFSGRKIPIEYSSAYDVKNNLCLFESPLKIQKNGNFLFEISYFVLEMLTFFYYAN